MGRKRGRKLTPAPDAAAAPPARSWTAWLIPDLSLTAALAAVAYCLFVLRAPSRMFADSDGGWHIVVGEQILATGQIPHSDTFSFLATGRPWYAWEWAAEIVMGLFHKWQGMSGVVLLFTMTIGVVIWMCFRLHLRMGGDFFLALAMASPLVTTAQIHWLARPHVLSYLFLLGFLFYFERAGERFRARDALALAVGAALWAGVHGSFPLAIALALLYSAGYAARAVLWKDLDAALEWRRARWFLLAAACAAGGSLINPYGVELHKHVASFSTATEITSRIQEWRAFDFGRTESGQIVIVAALGGLGALLALRQRNTPHALAAAFVVALGLKSARGLPILALVALPMANAAITRALQGRKGALGWLMKLSADLRSLDRDHHGAALAPLAALGALAWLLQPAVIAETGFPGALYPVKADATIARLPASSRICTSSLFGGYYIYRFRGQRKIWIDGRADYFGLEPYVQFERIALSKSGSREALERVGFTHAVLENRAPGTRALEEAGWRRLYRDESFTVLEKP